VGSILGPIGYFFNIIFTYPILNALLLLYHLFGDIALSIIVLTIIIRLVLFPLYMKQLKSTKATQAIQPLMADIKKKYAKDQRAQMEAMQALYKEYGVNPAAGCLPLLIQLPVLYGLFYALRTALNSSLSDINKIVYPFLPHFTQKPNVYLDWFTFINPHWAISLGAPDPTHILPVLAGLATFIQLRMSQPRTTSATSNPMAQQMQIMQFVMPFITFFFALNFPAGLALYWTTTSVFSMVQQYFVTGWGSLAVMPDFLSSFLGGNNNSSSRSNGNNRNSSDAAPKEARTLQKNNEVGTTVVTSQDGAVVNGNGRVNSSNGSSSTRRRPRNSSASARRRGNAPKRNASRS
jgi:YidC/Oxa1 family membrane protein insertase